MPRRVGPVKVRQYSLEFKLKAVKLSQLPPSMPLSTLAWCFSRYGRSCPLLLQHWRLASFLALKDSGGVFPDGFSGWGYR